MDQQSGNIFDLPGHSDEVEVFTSLFKSNFINIQKINGLKPYSQPGQWYKQEEDEWVVLLEGSAVLEFENEKELTLQAGDYLFIPSHKVHRIKQTSESPKCLWLAIHGKLK